MGVHKADYVMLGIKFDYDKFKKLIPWEDGDMSMELDDYRDNPYSDQIGGKNNISVISDGMNGEYVMLGKIIAKSVDGDGFDHIACEASDLEKENALLVIKNMFLELQIKHKSDPIEMPILSDVKIWVFSHFH